MKFGLLLRPGIAAGESKTAKVMRYYVAMKWHITYQRDCNGKNEKRNQTRGWQYSAV